MGGGRAAPQACEEEAPFSLEGRWVPAVGAAAVVIGVVVAIAAYPLGPLHPAFRLQPSALPPAPCRPPAARARPDQGAGGAPGYAGRLFSPTPPSTPPPKPPNPQTPTHTRLRRYLLTVPAGAYIPTAMQGSADLTFKMKKARRGAWGGGGPPALGLAPRRRVPLVVGGRPATAVGRPHKPRPFGGRVVPLLLPPPSLYQALFAGKLGNRAFSKGGRAGPPLRVRAVLHSRQKNPQARWTWRGASRRCSCRPRPPAPSSLPKWRTTSTVGL